MTAPFGVYVHWPYCTRLCPYCDFNIYKDRGVDAARWSAALTRDLGYWAAQTPGRRLTSLYFGGGTPGIAPPAVIEAVIDAADRFWGFDADAEITIETNPADAAPARLAALRAAGANRLSLGVQSFDDAALAFLGRDHDAKTARAAIEAARATFPRVTADFIYARPGQTVDQWAEELSAALATGLTHLSLYQLTIEPGTAFGRQVAKGRWAPANDDLGADLFDLTQEMTAAAGLPAYEISNHAAAGDESRHNFLYWRQDDYVGVGPGAHARLTIDGARRAIETALDPNDYLSRVEEQGCGATLDEELSAADIFTEKLAMGLRTREGVLLAAPEWESLAAPFAELFADGLLTRTGGRLSATIDGRRILDTVLASLLAGRAG